METTLSVRHFFFKKKKTGFKTENTGTACTTEMQRAFKPAAILKVDA